MLALSCFFRYNRLEKEGVPMKNKNPGYMTTPRERVSYWTYFVGQNVYYNITAAFISTYLAMQGISLTKVAVVLLIVKVWEVGSAAM